MAVFSGKWTLVLAAGLLGMGLFAQQTPADPTPVRVSADGEVFRCKRADLQGHPFQLDGLTVTIRGYHKRGSGKGEYFDIRVDNPSMKHVKFDPGNLHIVNRGGFEFNGAPIYNTGIAPGAWIAYSYQISGGFSGAQVEFSPPFRIYFGDRLLAEIAD